MPKLLYARQPEDGEVEKKIRKLAGSRHAPGDWIFRARIVSLSWQGLRTTNPIEREHIRSGEGEDGPDEGAGIEGGGSGDDLQTA